MLIRHVASYLVLISPFNKASAMANYDEIKAAIENETAIPSQAIQAKYLGDLPTDLPRKFLAYVLGKSHVPPPGPPRDSVLGYQYEGAHTSSDDSKKWRCFKVDDLSALTQINFVPPTSTLNIPPPLTADQLKRQNCVDIPGGRIERKVIYQP
jgi:hypothetical protein